MSVEMLKEANPVPPDETTGSVREEDAKRLLALILSQEPPRPFSTRPRAIAPTRLVRTAAVAVVLVLVALAFSVTLPFGRGDGGGSRVAQLGVLDRAAAALPDRGEVVHVVWLQPDFASGKSAMTLKYRDWLDRSRKTDHLIISKGRKTLDTWAISGKSYIASNSLIDSKKEPYLYGTIAGGPYASLIVDYRKALESGRVVLIGPGRAFGKPVYWVRFRCPPTIETTGQLFLCAERLALDKHTYVPVASEIHTFKEALEWNRDHTRSFVYQTSRQSAALQTAGAGVPMRYRILKVELVPREKANIIPPAGILAR